IARIFEASHARGFCPSFTRASHPQLHFRNPISKSYRLTFYLLAYLINVFRLLFSPVGMKTPYLIPAFQKYHSSKPDDCPDCEDSQFCHSSRVSHPQLHLGIRYPNLID
ncbi:hypothetical protein Tco_1378912, partial [Tanacetum coccineum]